MTTTMLIALFMLIEQPMNGFDEFIARIGKLPVEGRKEFAGKFLAGNPRTPIIEQDSVIHFLWYGKGRTVMIRGDLQQGWRTPDTLESIPCGEDTLFFRSYKVPADSRLDYQFVVDGRVTTDPRNPRTAPSGYGLHSEVVMPRFKPSSATLFRENIPHGTIDSMRFASTDDSIKPRTIRIYKPAGYDKLAEMPTLYVNDGEDALNYALIKNVLDNLIDEKKIEPVIAVFIPPVERAEEYTGLKLRGFTKAVCDELVPLIDRNYRTSRDPRRRAVIGISNGGHFSLSVLFRRPDVFRSAAGQSSAITPQLYEIYACAAEGKRMPAANSACMSSERCGCAPIIIVSCSDDTFCVKAS